MTMIQVEYFNRTADITLIISHWLPGKQTLIPNIHHHAASPLVGDSTQPCTQKRTVKRILIRRGIYGYSANFHALRQCSHVRFCVRDDHVPSLARGA